MKRRLEPTTADDLGMLAQGLLATCIDLRRKHARAQEREAWTYAVLSYTRKQSRAVVVPPR